MEEAESVFQRETANIRRAYQAQMMSIDTARSAKLMAVIDMHRELLQTIEEMKAKSGWFSVDRLGTDEQEEFAEMEIENRKVESWYRTASAPIREAYAKAIAPAQARLQEARARGKSRSRSPSDLARERSQ